MAEFERLPKERCIVVFESGQLCVGDRVCTETREVQWTTYDIAAAPGETSGIDALEGGWFFPEDQQ